MGKKSRIRQQRERKELEKEVAYQKDLEYQSNSEKGNLKRAFLETAQAIPEVQQMITEAANEGQEITRKQVRRLSDEFTAATSSLLPEAIRQRSQENLLPPRIVAPLVRELAKLPKIQQADLCRDLKAEPEIDCIKDVTNTARWISKSMDASLALRAFQKTDLNQVFMIQLSLKKM